MNPQPIRFYHRGAVVEVQGPHPTRSVLDWLREDAHCTGTKEGCNEGDCGACTVVVGELDDAVPSGLALRSVNACLQFLPMLDGKVLFTVDDLARDGELHPVQQALVACHGSQCGFCTPGFVMSMWSVYQRHVPGTPPPGRQAMADALSGNLCRCTGYRPILDAGARMFEWPRVALDAAPVVAALRPVQHEDGLHYTAFNPNVIDGGVPRVDHFHAPRSLDALAGLCEQHPAALLLSGGTDIGLWVTKQMRDLGNILYLGEVAELKKIVLTDDALSVGAGASLEAAWDALARHWPALREVWLRFASPPIRHAGTLGGNVANGSPIGDSAPVLMALDAQVLLRHGTRTRRMPLDAFYTGYMESRLAPGEFLQAVVVPLELPRRTVRAYKISKRFDSDISAVCAGLSIVLDGERVREVRLAFGGMAATVQRAAGAEAALAGQPWTIDAVRVAQAALARDFKPLSDMRASAAYRLQVAQNLLHRFWLETRPHDPLPAQALNVWASRADALAGGAP